MNDDGENTGAADADDGSALSALRDSVAEGLAVLSDATDVPKGVTLAPGSFTATEVDFATGAWTSRLASVQGWLRFDADLPESSHEDFVAALVKELGLSNEEGIDSSGHGLSLSEDGLNALANRVDTACKLQVQFLDDLDAEGATKTAATTRWSEAWDENDDDVPISPDPVKAKAGTWHIYKLVDGGLNLSPSYQRGDVWSGPDRSALIESILRGVPLPSIILLKKGSSREVVDGKQRLTTILRFIGKHPIAKQKLAEAEARHPDANLRHLFYNDYPAFRRAWKTLEGNKLTSALENEYYFPFALRRGKESALRYDLEPLQGKFYCQIKNVEVSVADDEVEIEQLFSGMSDYEIPVIEYFKAEPRQIHEVFKLYNKQGVQLNAEEIRNAVYHELAITPAILFAAGDADPRVSVSEIAPFLADVPGLDELGDTLHGYGFGDSRYRRTKVLFWIIAVLLRDTSGKPLTTTAKHIDQLLDEITEDPNHPLTNHDTLAKLFSWVAAAAELHSGHSELWADSFKDGDAGAKWQELQLIGSFVGLALALIASPDDIEERLEAHADAIYEASATEWERIEKTQTKTQWDYIRRIVTGILQLMEIDPTQASQAVRNEYGSSGLASLQLMVLPPSD
ncbi:DUF262 domain-containing protein [Gordonia sp. (in: high G+C Gram-positive bacteria)]|uniref:DUF262 domain-containing protein n=1 Tax=Gordonia sp. (in: high G+C Gram-positive bacteria) TaxID=84139 RepID=UPI0039E559EF